MSPNDAPLIAHGRHEKTTAYFFQFCLLTATFLIGVSVPVIAQIEYGDEISLALMKPSGQVFSPNGPAVSLRTRKAVKQPGDHLATFLRSRGFHFDGSSASLFYRANPRVEDFAEVPVGAELNAPDIEKTPDVRNALKDGFVVYVTTDKVLKESVISEINQLMVAKSAFVELDVNVFASAEEKQTLINEISRATEYLRDVRTLIQDNVQPFGTEMLKQYRGDVELLLSIVRDASVSGHLPQASKDSISLIVEDISTKARGLSGSKSVGEVPSDPHGTMIVRIKPEKDPRIDHMGIRVCYAPVALRNRFDECWPTTGPATLPLPVAKYQVWLAVTKTSPSLSIEPLEVELEDGKTTAVDVLFR